MQSPPGRLLAAESLAVTAMACVATAVRFHSTPTLRASTPYICAKGALEPRGRPSPLHLMRKTAMRSGTTTPGTNPGAEDGPGTTTSEYITPPILHYTLGGRVSSHVLHPFASPSLLPCTFLRRRSSADCIIAGLHFAQHSWRWESKNS